MTTSVDSAPTGGGPSDQAADVPPPAATLERRGHVAVITLNRPNALTAFAEKRPPHWSGT